ncbi:phage tail assembly protein [Chitiniphilus eburneus]|uniref:Phage tail assembly protein n=1 Tax=Chitiniphilus eburneus TaxID=2571148 RepID=A0A4U0QBM5_9NEIS|nr:phage tail assembly protein [Chitiniphilus eburneus]TJZ78791.1 phage tail assembly protein [Chitiniphilus eburneus]
MNQDIQFPLVVTLSKPLRFGEEDITELRLREPCAGDFRVLANPQAVLASSLDLAAELAGLPSSVLDRLNTDDTEAVVRAVNPFLFWFR